MRRFRFAWVVAGLLVVAACCPSIWFTVTKGDVAPRPSVPVPVIANPPILLPPQVQNRIDVFARGRRISTQANFTESFDPADDFVTAEARALQARADLVGEIAAAAHQAAPADRFDPTEGSTDCADGTVIDAHETLGPSMLSFAGGLPAAATVMSIRRLGSPPEVHVIETCETKTYQPSQANPQAPCAPPGGDHPVLMRVTQPLAAKPGDVLHVCTAPTLTLSRPLLAFVHASDIQIREGAVTLGDRDLSRRFDWVIQSFEYDNDLQFYNQYMAEATVATINKAVAVEPDPRLAPSFVIHTGDGIDAGVMSELVRFHQLIDRMSVPVFDVLGNHDVLIFGNLLPSVSRDSDATCSTAHSVTDTRTSLLPGKLCVDQVIRCDTCTTNEEKLVAGATHAATRASFIGGLTHATADAVPQFLDETNGDYCTLAAIPGTRSELGMQETKIYSSAFTREHGFDLNRFTDGSAAGYYAFARPVTINGLVRHALFIVLNGQDLKDGDGGTAARIGPTQLAWLKAVLNCVKHVGNEHDLVFVFAHQPLSLLRTDSKDTVEDALVAAAPNVVGFLYGHYHAHAICGDYIAGQRETTCQHFWEVETGSLIEYPQEMRLVRLKQLGADIGFLELTTFGERLADPTDALGALVALARRGAERDFCRTHKEAVCSADLRPYRTDGRDTHGRLFFQLP